MSRPSQKNTLTTISFVISLEAGFGRPGVRADTSPEIGCRPPGKILIGRRTLLDAEGARAGKRPPYGRIERIAEKIS
jgi:hypothetical protein